MSTLTLKGINKIYPNGYHAVHDFNLEINDGEFIVFVGPSGCGKSTTLRMIAGLEDISKGEFLINGVRANEMGPRERGVAMVFQSYALYPQMTVYDNIAFGLTLQGVDEDEIDRKVKKTAAILGLTDYLDRLPRALSGGQRQRVAIGRAIIRKVNIFLMDEPLSNLDAKQRVTMRSEIAQIHNQTGATTIYVTHDQTEAMTLADRIVVMKLGYVQQIGTPYELYFNPCNVFVAGFIGEPPMNFVNGTVKNGKFIFGENVMDLKPVLGEKLAQYEGKDIIFGFRPEAVKTSIDFAKAKDGLPVEYSETDVIGQDADAAKIGAANNAYPVNCTIELTEMLGDKVNIYVKTQEERAIVNLSLHHMPESDEKITFYIPYESVYLFDKETENVIKK